MRRLLIRPGAIGDCILSLPALEFLRTDYTEIWVPSAVVPLIRFANCVRAIASTGLDLLGLPEVDPPSGLIERLRSFDTIVSWYGTNRGEFRAQTANLGLPFQFLPALPPAGAQIHAADFFLQQVGGGPEPAVPSIACSAAQAEDFAIIQPFSGSRRKNWPLECYRELASRLSFPVRWCAGPEEELDDAVRMDNLYDLACWIRTGRIYVGNDSGITHLAAAAGARVVAIFGPSDPAVWAPRGDRVRVIQGDLSGITVDQVLAAVDWLQ